MHTASRGVRTLSAAALEARRLAIRDASDGATRRDLSAAARLACAALRLKPSSRLVLHELVGAYGGSPVAGALMVWPSNRYLVDRTGLCERSVRAGIADLVGLRVLAPVDSANRKRFPIRQRGGAIQRAYGFDLTPLYLRREEFAAVLDLRNEERAALARLHDDVTIARKAIEAALHALLVHFPTANLAALVDEFGALIRATPRRGRVREMTPLADLVRLYDDLRRRVEDVFRDNVLAANPAASAGEPCRHIESEPESVLVELVAAPAPGRMPPIGIILSACPEVSDLHPDPILDERELVRVGRGLAGCIGIGPEAWSASTEAIGAVRAAILALIALQLHADDVASGQGRIKNPGGLYRSFVQRVSMGRYDIEAEIQALRRKRMT